MTGAEGKGLGGRPLPGLTAEMFVRFAEFKRLRVLKFECHSPESRCVPPWSGSLWSPLTYSGGSPCCRINKAAADALKIIMRNGTRTTKTTKAFGDGVEFKLPNGLVARFNAVTNEFNGFLGRGR